MFLLSKSRCTAIDLDKHTKLENTALQVVVLAVNYSASAALQDSCLLCELLNSYRPDCVDMRAFNLLPSNRTNGERCTGAANDSGVRCHDAGPADPEALEAAALLQNARLCLSSALSFGCEVQRVRPEDIAAGSRPAITQLLSQIVKAGCMQGMAGPLIMQIRALRQRRASCGQREGSPAPSPGSSARLVEYSGTRGSSCDGHPSEGDDSADELLEWRRLPQQQLALKWMNEALRLAPQAVPLAPASMLATPSGDPCSFEASRQVAPLAPAGAGDASTPATPPGDPSSVEAPRQEVRNIPADLADIRVYLQLLGVVAPAVLAASRLAAPMAATQDATAVDKSAVGNGVDRACDQEQEPRCADATNARC